MKTIQQCLQEADREILLSAMAHDKLSDKLMLLEMQDSTVKEIQANCKELHRRHCQVG